MAQYSPEKQEILHLIKGEILESQRPAEEVIFDDVDF